MARFFWLAATMVVLLPLPLSAGEPQGPQEVLGRVIDENGKPVAGCACELVVEGEWAASSAQRLEGKSILDTPEGQRIVWGNLGKMEPWHAPATTDAHGRFTFSFAGAPQVHYLMSMNAVAHARRIGNLVKGQSCTTDRHSPGTPDARQRLARGAGKGRAPGMDLRLHARSGRCRATARHDPTGGLRVVRSRRFEMALPPGRYLLNAYTFRDKDNETAEVVPDTEVVVTGKVSEIDVGVLHLSPFKPTITVRKERAKAAGTWGDYTKHYGEKPPQWHVVDARGRQKGCADRRLQGEVGAGRLLGPELPPVSRQVDAQVDEILRSAPGPAGPVRDPGDLHR